MNTRIRRSMAYFALILLLLSIFAVAWHDITPTHDTQSTCDELTCALCAFGDILSKAILPVLVAFTVTACAKIDERRANSPTFRLTTRSFPMLC